MLALLAVSRAAAAAAMLHHSMTPCCHQRSTQLSHRHQPCCQSSATAQYPAKLTRALPVPPPTDEEDTASEDEEKAAGWGQEDTYIVDCPCGVTFDDGHMMIECENCKVWAHTECLQMQMVSGWPGPPCVALCLPVLPGPVE